jgi:hypothetical protein
MLTKKDLEALFTDPLPRVEIRHGILTLMRKGNIFVPLPPNDRPFAQAARLLQFSNDVFFDLRIAELRKKWPDQIEIYEIIELEKLLGSEPPLSTPV